MAFNVNCENDLFPNIYLLKTDSGQPYYKHPGTVFNVIVKMVSGGVYDTLLKQYQDDD